MTALRRRSLLGTALAAAGVASANSTSADGGVPRVSDAILIQLCGELIELETTEVAIYDGPNRIVGDKEAARVAAPVHARIHDIIMELSTVQAATAAGVLARARALAAFGGDFGASFDWPEDEGAGRMLALLLRDAAALGAPLPRVVVDPDQLRIVEGGAT